MLVDHVGEVLLTHEELTVTARAQSMSPLDLRRRCLIKGKVKLADKAADTSRSSSRSCGEPSRVPRPILRSVRLVVPAVRRASPCSAWRRRDDAGNALEYRIEKVAQFAPRSKLDGVTCGLEGAVRCRRGGIVQRSGVVVPRSGGLLQRRGASHAPSPRGVDVCGPCVA